MNYVPAIGIDAIDSPRPRIDLRANSHPADHFCGIGKKVENYRGRRVNVDFFDDGLRTHSFPSLPPLPPTSAWPASRPRMFRENSATARTPPDGFDRAGSYPVSVPSVIPP